MKSKLRIRFYNSVCLVYCLGEKNDLLIVFKYTTGPGKRMVPRLREFFKQGQEQISPNHVPRL